MKEEIQAPKVSREKPDLKVHQVYLVNLEDPVHQVNVGKRDHQEKEVQMVSLDYLAQPVFLVRMEWTVNLENQEFQANEEHQANEETPDFRVDWECQA